MFLLNSVKSLVLIQSGNAFHCLAAKYEKELRPKLVVLKAYKGTKCYCQVDHNRRTEVKTSFSM